MQVREVMTSDPVSCSADTTLREAATLMVDNDCGEIPVLDSRQYPIGVVTDRDIACRAVAEGRSPDTAVREIMSSPVITTTPESSLEDCCAALEDNQIRRVPVVDANGRCCGIVAQADIALHASPKEIAEVLRDVSQPVLA
jgi:CBS domain-containing protein